MPVVGTAKPIGENRPGEDLAGGRKRFTQTYFVQTDHPLEGPTAVLGAAGLPALYEPHLGHPQALCVSRFPRSLPNSRIAWHVECEWDTHYPDRDDNPLLERPEVEWDADPYDEPLAGTAAEGYTTELPNPNDSQNGVAFIKAQEFAWGQGILNSAGDPYQPPPTIPSYYPVVRFTRNEQVFDARYALLYGNTINKTNWNGLLPRQAWLKPIKATHMVHLSDRFDTADILYWKVRYEFVLKASTWDLALLNHGPRYLTAPRESTNPIPLKLRFADLDGYPEMDLLKADGTRFRRPGTNDENDAGEPIEPTFSVYRVRREVDWNPLLIDINLPLNDLKKRRR